MKISEALGRVDVLFYNTFSAAEKIAWLSRLDHQIKRNIIDTHEGEGAVFSGYDADTDGNTELLVPEPYDALYLHWLQAQRELNLKETENYNASILAFNAEYEAFENDWNRNHMPKGCGRFRF